MVDRGFIPAFLQCAESQPNRCFASFAGVPIGFAQLRNQAESLAAALQARGLAPGDRVAVMMTNSPAALAVIFALARAGLVWVPVNGRLRGPGLRFILEHCDPALIIADRANEETLEACGAALPASGLVWHDGGGEGGGADLDQLLSGRQDCDMPLPRSADLFAIMYTSGTTGPPKGVQVTHAMMRFAGEGVLLATGTRPGDVFHMWEPLCHIGGAQMLMVPLLADCRLAMERRFSAASFWQEVRAAEATHMHYLGGVLQILLKQPPNDLDRTHGLRVAWGGGCPVEVWRPFEERFGVEIRECYGMTEASSITTFNSSGLPGAVGQAVDWLEVAICDADGRSLPAGARGEIVTRARQGAALFDGYFRNPEASAKALRGGRLHTGDLGSLDGDGNLTFYGRLSDSLRCRGENVSAWEVERVAAGHPAVEDCAVIGVAAEIGEQDIKLFVQLRTGAELDFAALAAWLAERLAPYQLPRYYRVIEDFERTPSQRIMKHRLSAALDDGWDRLAGP